MSSQEPPKKKSKRDDGLFCFVQGMDMRGCHVFCASIHQRVPYGETLITALNHKLECFCKSACAIIKYAPQQYTLERTTWRK